MLGYGIELFRKFHPDIVVVLLDMVLPRYHGNEVFQELRVIDPDAAIIMTSGIGDTAQVPSEAAGFLKKPYREVELQYAVQQAIRRNR